ncbi:MAG: hypothetical protein LBB08_02090 [Rickettsiales bacterium]|jgi:hypothetical protein|nr:hypothetical protein [Rickettsiales bacterium]
MKIWLYLGVVATLAACGGNSSSRGGSGGPIITGPGGETNTPETGDGSENNGESSESGETPNYTDILNISPTPRIETVAPTNGNITNNFTVSTSQTLTVAGRNSGTWRIAFLKDGAAADIETVRIYQTFADGDTIYKDNGQSTTCSVGGSGVCYGEAIVVKLDNFKTKYGKNAAFASYAELFGNDKFKKSNKYRATGTVYMGGKDVHLQYSDFGMWQMNRIQALNSNGNPISNALNESVGATFITNGAKAASDTSGLLGDQNDYNEIFGVNDTSSSITFTGSAYALLDKTNESTKAYYGAAVLTYNKTGNVVKQELNAPSLHQIAGSNDLSVGYDFGTKVLTVNGNNWGTVVSSGDTTGTSGLGYYGSINSSNVYNVQEAVGYLDAETRLHGGQYLQLSFGAKKDSTP